MAQKTYFINSTQAAYTDEEFAWFQTLLLSQGIIGNAAGAIGMQVAQLGTPGMGVQVSAGKALVQITKGGRTFKVVVENDAAANVLIAGNSSGSNRVDAIIVRVDVDAEPNVSKSNVGTIEVVLGSGVAALNDAAVQAAIGSDGFYRLANVTVANGAVSILNGSIADTRSKVTFTDAMGFSPLFTTTSAGAADAGKIPKLDASGKLDVSFLDVPLATMPSLQAIDGTTTPQAVGMIGDTLAKSEATAAVGAIFNGFVRKNNNGAAPVLLHSANVGVGGSYTAPAGTKRYVVIAWLTYGLGGITLPTTVTWNGRTFTKINENGAAARTGVAMWGCVIGDSASTEVGTNSINGSGRGTTDVFMATYGNIDQANPVATQNVAALSSSGATVSVTPTQGYSLIIQASTYRGNPVGIDARMTVRQNTTQSQLGDHGAKGTAALAYATSGSAASGSEQIATSIVVLKGATYTDTEVVIGGVLGGFSGLTPGAIYYLSNTEGAIATSAGSVSVKVGRAVSATRLHVMPLV